MTTLTLTAANLRPSDIGKTVTFDYVAPYTTTEEHVSGRLAAFYASHHITLYLDADYLGSYTITHDTTIEVTA